MSTIRRIERTRTGTGILETLTDVRRRRILALLVDESTPVAVDDLAARVAAAEQSSDETDVHVDLQHTQLPKLADAGLVTYEDGVVSLTDHPILSDEQFQRVLAIEADGWDEIVETVADGRRRDVLTVLRSRDGRLTTDELAREVADREDGQTPASETVEEVHVQLHHVHLPKLDRAGLVRYDAEAGTVASPDVPDDSADR